MNAAPSPIRHTDFPGLRRGSLETLQVNLGYRCNQACTHCHVDAGPNRTEEMRRPTVDQVLDFLSASRVHTLDITGGAPEINVNFRYLVECARANGVHVIDRCNLTVLLLAEQEDLAAFLAAHRVEITASLPCYLPENVERQRGKGVFKGSIDALRRLNALGYGQPDSGLILNLVYNPQGPRLPPPQAALEDDYRRHLGDEFGVMFNRLYALANLPIHRFRHALVRDGELDAYMALLRGSHSPQNLDAVMCRSLISVDWQGYVYDCDFNQMAGVPLQLPARERVHITELTGFNVEGNPIQVADHCYGCTAGQGSSCGGALRQRSLA
jgi:radical SAM/Cys-rich protein